MSKLQRSILLSILVPVFALAPAGCRFAGAGAYGGYRFVNGEYKGVVDADLVTTVQATRAAFDELDIRETMIRKVGSVARIEGLSTGYRTVRVTLEAAGDTTTNARVRVDTFGDKSFSQIVMEKINANL